MKKPITLYQGNTVIFVSPRFYKKLEKLKKGKTHYAKKSSN